MKFGEFEPWYEYMDPVLKDMEHYVFKFENGYGASVIRGPYSHGGNQELFELAAMEQGEEGWNFVNPYKTPFDAAVMGFLDANEVADLLRVISKWKKVEP